MKRKMASKALSLLLTLCMVIGLLPGMALTASAEEAPHNHSSGWTELTNKIVSASGGYLASGNYYLSDDLTLTNNLIINGQKVTICLNGNVLTGKTTYDSSVIQVQYGGTLTICDCQNTEHKGYIDADGRLWHKLETDATVPEGGTECNLTGGVITGGNIGSGQGGAVYIDSGTVTFTGGNIAGNKAGYGGGVYNNKGTLNLNGGKIVGNKCSFWGGGVCSVGGTVEMTGGAISYNTTDSGNNGNYGGGVYSDGTFNMTGGTISRNYVNGKGGGVYLSYGKAASIADAAITNNTASDSAAGVYCNTVNFTLSGMVNISENKIHLGTESRSNLYLDQSSSNNVIITLTNALNTASRIGISLPKLSYFAQGSGYIASDYKDCFFADDPKKMIEVEVSGSYSYLELITNPTPYTVTFNANGGRGTMDARNIGGGDYDLPECEFTAPEGKRFAGWALSAEGPVISTYTVDKDFTLYAIWRDPVPVSIQNGGYPYLQKIVNGQMILAMDAAGDDVTYQWQVADSKNGEYSNIGNATESTYTFYPASGKWYRCVVSGTASKAVMAVKSSSSTWTTTDSKWYLSNGTMAYTFDGTSFDVVGLYQKTDTDYMMSVSNGGWEMYSYTDAEPYAGNTVAATLDALKVSFSETDAYTLNFEADLAEGQQAFAIGCDTELGNNATSGDYYNTGALKAMVKNGTLSQIAMVGAGSFETAADTDPAFVIKPLDPASKFWIGNYYSRETYAYNTFGGDATETVGGQEAVTLVKNTDSGMTMSWMNVESGGSVKFQFRVGSVANVNGGVDYATEHLTGLTANEVYTITVDETPYNLTADENGKIPLSGTDTGAQPYDLIGKTITIQKNGETAFREITVAARPAAPDRPTALSLTAAEKPEDLPSSVEVREVSKTSVTIKPKAGQEYEYSINGTNWTLVNGTQVTGLSGDSVRIRTRRPGNKFYLASEFSAPVTVALRPMLTASASGSGTYDGKPHSITVTAPEGATIQYSASYSGKYGEEDNPSYTDAGYYNVVYYRVTKEGCYPAYGSARVNISKKTVNAVLTVAEKTYDGTAVATVTAAVNSGLISGDSISITGLTGTFDNANAGENKTVTVNSSGKSITGTGTDNYTVTIPASATGKINPKPITVTADAKTKTYGEADPELTYTVDDGGLVGSDTLTGALTRAPGVNVGTYAIGLGTLANSNYTITFEGADLTITQRTIHPSVTMADYEYGTTPSTPVINADQGDGAVTYYYSTYSDIATEETHRLEWKDITGTTLNVGTYYMAAHVAGTDNCTEGTTALITFKVTPSSYEQPTAPTVSDFTVTIDEADREKKLEYAVVTQGSPVPTNYVSVPTLNSSGSFDLTGLAESIDYTVYLRQKASADGNYAASDPVSADFTTPARYSVAYNANYGSGTVPASVTQNSGSSVTVASGSGLRRTGYTFSGWNTMANGSGTAYAAGATINTGATLYAQWTPNTYTVKFNANGGAGTMADQDFTYDAAAALSTKNFTKAGYHFAGWATSAGGAVVYSDQQSVKNLASGGSVTLYAVWVQNVYGISGTITSASNEPVTVKLMRGTTEVDSSSVSMTGSTSYTGTYGFSNIPAGTYNIVATQTVSEKTRTVTALVVVTNGDQTENITVPNGDTSSVLKVEEDTRPVVVGGLDDEASTKAEAGKSVTVTMTVEKQEEQQLPDTASQAEQQTQEAIAEIKAEASGKTLEFMDIEVKKDVTVGGSTTTEKLAVTNTVMEIVIPYDMAGKNNITVYRYHGGTAETFTESTAKTDGTFSLDRDHDLIYLYAQKFSTYAIGYTVPSSGGSGGGGSSSTNYPVTVPDSTPDGGKINVSTKSASKGSTVTITVAPDDGYELDKLSVKDKNGKEIAITAKGNGKYTFTMPAGTVTIKGTFKSAEWNIGYVDCPKDNTCPIWPYTDAKTTDWYHDGVHFCLENGLMVGYGDNIFQPNAPTTRAMLIVMLWRLNGSPVVNYALDFADVKEGTWYTEAVRWAKSEGVAGGYGNGKFGPNDTLTREQMVTMLFRYARYKGYDVSVGEDTNILSFDDATTVAEYAIPAMQWACGSGVVGGKDAADGSGLILDPKGSTTRAQMATMVMRFCAEIVK